MLVDFDKEAPKIAIDIKNIIDNLQDYTNYVLFLQLDYRENSTLFFLNKVESIYFNEYMLEVKLINGSVLFFEHEYILEYSVINMDDVKIEGVETV